MIVMIVMMAMMSVMQKNGNDTQLGMPNIQYDGHDDSDGQDSFCRKVHSNLVDLRMVMLSHDCYDVNCLLLEIGKN